MEGEGSAKKGHAAPHVLSGERPNAKTAESSDEEEVEVEVKISNSEALALIESLKKFYNLHAKR